MRKLVKKDLTIYATVVIDAIIFSFFLTVTRYEVALARLIDACGDLCSAIWFYLKFIFTGKSEYVGGLNELPEIDLASVIGVDVAELVRKLEAFPDAFFLKENFLRFNQTLSWKLLNFSRVLTLLIPIILLLTVLFCNSLFSENNDHGQKTRPLRLFLKVTTKPYRKVKGFLSGLKKWLSEHKKTVWLFLCIWAINLNLITIAASVFAYYFYFAASFDFTGLFMQAIKLLIDLLITYSGLWIGFWIIFGYIVFDKIRRKIGYNNLRHNERKNRGVLNALPICLYTVGRMGSKKTMTMTDMILSMNVEFRDKALSKLQKFALHFPNFKWQLLENDLKDRMSAGEIFNLASTRQYIKGKQDAFALDPKSEDIYDYNLIDNSREYDNALTVATVWENISTYAEAFFIYVVTGSYSMSNYSIRFDTVKDDRGNFPIYKDDFFDRPSYREGDGSTYSRIIDYDLFRLGQQMSLENNRHGAFEFGIFSASELAKERGNQNDTRGMKRSEAEANQLNDLFNYSPKLARHPATVDYFPFVRFFFDDQRADSLNADLRQLCSTIDILEASEEKLAMPGFVFGDMIFDLLSPAFNKLQLKLRHLRGDTTLVGFCVVNFAAFLNRFHERIYNTFGYYESVLLVDEEDEFKYYLANKKVLANRFATDCFEDYFADRSLDAKFNFNDYLTYRSSRATLDELNMQNSYFMRDLSNIFEEYEDDDDDYDDDNDGDVDSSENDDTGGLSDFRISFD